MNRIPAIPNSQTKVVRMPNAIIERIEKYVKENGGTFTSFVVNACCQALKDLREEE